MHHGIAPNGGGTKVNQYTFTMDVMVEAGGAAGFMQIDSLENTNDSDFFWQGSNFGQGGGGYRGQGTFTPDEWHRVSLSVDLAADPPLIIKYVDGIKQDDWVQQSLDQNRRALKEFSILFTDGDQDEQNLWYVSAVQIREGALTDAQLALLGGPSASGISIATPQSGVAGQWDFNSGNLGATVGTDLEFIGGAGSLAETETIFDTTTNLGIADINGEPANVMVVPDMNSRDIAYKMFHGIAPNGGGTKVNQYTFIMDVMVEAGGAAGFMQIDSLENTNDSDYFWQGNNFGQGGGGYNGLGTFTGGEWHRVSLAVDLASDPPLITKFVDGIKQDDWVQQALDQNRRALKEFAFLFTDGDQDEQNKWYVNSVQIREGKLSDQALIRLGGPSAAGIPLD
jgi:hypothetical protein